MLSVTSATNVPSEADTLCEGCGYRLTGLPVNARCPECGKPTSESAATLRKLPLWEDFGKSSRIYSFWQTSWQIIFHPGRFFRDLSIIPSPRSRHFAYFHFAIVSIILGSALWIHVRIVDYTLPLRFFFAGWSDRMAGSLLFMCFLILLIFGFLVGMTRIASWLTTWEAGLRGLRLPLKVVRRALDYHAPHYLPVALLSTVTIATYRLLQSIAPDWSGRHELLYMGTLAAEVLLCSAYVFTTYWIAMRRLMYANRPPE